MVGRCLLFALSLLVSLPLGLTAAQAQLSLIENFDLSGEDVNLARVAAAVLFEDDAAVVGQRTDWSNAASGNSGEVILARVFTHQGLPCKEVEHVIRQRSFADPVHLRFTRCQVADGSWKSL